MKKLYALICSALFWGLSNAGRGGYSAIARDGEVLSSAKDFYEWLKEKG